MTFELDRGHRGEQLEVVLALQALAHDVHVEQSEKAAAKAEAERVGGLGLPGEGGVVEGELFERVAQIGIVVGVDREQAAEDHRLDLLVAGERLGRFAAGCACHGTDRHGPGRRPLAHGAGSGSGRARARAGGGASRERVADAQLGDILEAGDQVAHLAGRQPFAGGHGGREEADVVDLGLGARRHRPDQLALRERAVDDADIGDHTAVLVELGVEDQRARGRVGIAGGRRDAPDQLLEHLGDTGAGLAADAQDRLGRLAEQLGDFAGDALGFGAGQVELVQAGDQLEAGLDG